MTNRPRFNTIFYFVGRHKLLYSGMLALIIAGSFAEAFSLAAFFPVFVSVLDTNSRSGGVLGWISKAVELVPISSPLVAAAVLLIILFSLKTVLMLMRVALTALGSAKTYYEVRKQILDRYANAQYQFYLDHKQGTLIYNSMSAPSSLGTLLIMGPQLIANTVKIVVIFALLAAIFPLAAIAFGALGLLYYGIIYYVSRRVSFRIGQEQARANAAHSVIANEFYTGIREILASAATKPWLERFDRENRITTRLYAQVQLWSGTPRHIMELAGVMVLLGSVLYLFSTRPGGLEEDLPKLGVFAVAMVQILPALNSMGTTWMAIMTSLPNVELAYEAITGPMPLRADGETKLKSFDQAIVFESVSFAHQGRENLYNQIDMTFEKGKVTAIVGQSGSGKTTIVNLILGLFEPTGGRITVDGVPINELERESWVNMIGFVSQEPFTHHTTITENILFGREGHSLDSIVNAAKIAHAHEFITELPQGYDTIVGDWGMTLSGGQQQRLAIARALLDSPEILIFDEATSSLDTVSERLVQEAIESVSHDRTVILIAHRLSTIKHADNIIVLDNGRVVEQGSHEELIDSDSHFARLVASSA